MTLRADALPEFLGGVRPSANFVTFPWERTGRHRSAERAAPT
jgi:hypothetical protein